MKAARANSARMGSQARRPEGQANQHQRETGDNKPEKGEGLWVAAVYAVKHALRADAVQCLAHGQHGEGIVQHAGGNEGKREPFQHGELRK